MKKLFLLLLISATVFAQPQFIDASKDSVYYGAPGDSVSVIYPYQQYKYVYVTYQDTGSTATLGGLTDSLNVQSYEPKLALWHDVGLIDVTTNTTADSLVGLSGSVKKYLVNEERPYALRIILTNYRAAHPARKGYVAWSGRND